MFPKKVAIVTGGNKGIGFGICRGLAKVFDGDVYLTARSEERGLQAVQALGKENLVVKFHQLDIDNKESISNLAAYIKEKYGGIDVLVNNAGIMKDNAIEPFGYQAKVTIATNYYSVKSTCELLFPLLRSGARVVNLSSDVGFLGTIPNTDLKKKFASSDSTLTFHELDALMDDFVASVYAGNLTENGWPNTNSALSAYFVSKVGVSAMSRMQQRDINKNTKLKDVAVNHIHPGGVKTDMSPDGTRSIDDGAISAIFAATLPADTDIKGQYIWCDCTVVDWVNGPRPINTE